MAEPVLNLGEDAAVTKAFIQGQPAEVTRAADPVLTFPGSPVDFAAQYPTPLDVTEILDLCEELGVWRAIPEQRTQLQAYTWREMTTLRFSGTLGAQTDIAFGDGLCPEPYIHDGANTTVTLKNIGARKVLSVSDILHSAAVAGANWNGINTLVGPSPASAGLPGGDPQGTFVREHVANLKEKEARLGMTLVMNGWDRLLVQGDATTRALEFNGIENWASGTSAGACMHGNDNSASGTFSAISFDRFLAESCAKPTHIFGHPQALQEMMSAYLQLGAAGIQVINYNSGNRVTPGYNFAGQVNTGVGLLQVVADNNFRRTAASATTFQADLWAFRMVHNGEPLVYKITQIPLSMTDLTPGCTAISFQIWAKTALVIKACCMHGRFIGQFTGRITSTCTVLG